MRSISTLLLSFIDRSKHCAENVITTLSPIYTTFVGCSSERVLLSSAGRFESVSATLGMVL